MKLNINACAVENFDSEVIKILIDFFNYTMENVNSYEELTLQEKSIISKELFNKICMK